MNRIKLTVSYDGTEFRGWAISPGHRTVQGTLTEAIERAIGQVVEVVGASRTDSGAHARGQVCHFDTSVPIETEKWSKILNRILPGDVAIWGSRPVSNDFHARFCAEDRFYRYRIRQSGKDPLAGRYAYEYGRELNVRRMQEAAGLLVGKHDYLAFTEELDPSVENTTRTLRQVDVYEAEPESFGVPGREIWVDVVGTAFLRGMMRRMAGALLEVGAGKQPVDTIRDLLTDKRSEMHWPIVLPAKGLCLMRVRYGDPPRDCRNSGSEDD